MKAHWRILFKTDRGQIGEANVSVLRRTSLCSSQPKMIACPGAKSSKRAELASKVQTNSPDALTPSTMHKSTRPRAPGYGRVIPGFAFTFTEPAMISCKAFSENSGTAMDSDLRFLQHYLIQRVWRSTLWAVFWTARSLRSPPMRRGRNERLLFAGL